MWTAARCVLQDPREAVEDDVDAFLRADSPWLNYVQPKIY
ncbi:MAG: hypothetical protein K0S56_2627 [Microvirga sp.]|jgi:hypothetical protein|nr:hypothetical protein [Microvirga sp.]